MTQGEGEGLGEALIHRQILNTTETDRQTTRQTGHLKISEDVLGKSGRFGQSSS